MFDILHQLPLFQGLAHEDFIAILENVNLCFTNYQAGKTLIWANVPCDRLFYLLQGEVEVKTTSPDGNLIIKEYIKGPHLFEPESLYGRDTQFHSTYTAQTDCSTLYIKKQFILTQLVKYNIFQLNFLNILSSRIQRYRLQAWTTSVEDFKERLYQFLVAHCDQPKGKKVLITSMSSLGACFNENRFNMSAYIHDLESKGLIQHQRHMITIPELKKLKEL